MTQSLQSVSIQYIGGPTAIVEFGGLRFLTDPTFDAPGDYPVGNNRVLKKLAGPALSMDNVDPIDAVLLSHDQHPDNLDTLGRRFVMQVPLVLSTAAARERLGSRHVKGLPNWQRFDLTTPGGTVRVVGVPALHGPKGSESLVGEVAGFVLSNDGWPKVYVSGDNASLEIVGTIARRLGPIDIAILFAGAAQTALVKGGYLTLTSQQAAEAARILGARMVVPLHFEQWAHFTEGGEQLKAAFIEANLQKQLIMPRLGQSIELP